MIRRRMPVSDSDSRLKKTILLRTLEDELSKASITERMLETLEVLEEVLRCEGSPISAAMSAAYCGVAVECTLKFLELEASHPNYLSAVERIWRGRVRYMEPSSSSSGEGNLLFSAELNRWRSDIEASLTDPRVMDKLAATVNTRRDAIKKLKLYLAEAWTNVAPSFLSLAAECLTGNLVGIAQESSEHQERVSPTEIQKDNQLLKGKHTATGAEEMDPSTTFSKTDSVPSHEVPKTGESLERSSLELQTLAKDPLPNSFHMSDIVRSELAVKDMNQKDNQLLKGKCTATGAEEMDASTTFSKTDSVPSHEVPMTGKSLERSSLELQTLAKDPLPNSFHMSDIVRSVLAVKDMNQEPPMENQSRYANVPNPHACQSINNNEANLNETTPVHQSDVHYPSLMELNSTARTHEWDDSIDSLEGGISYHASRFHLPSPKRKKLSPLKKYETINVTKRRKPKKWTELEVETLRTAVSKIGKGNWKLILNSYRDIFEERTEVDLKDKWRNLTRYGGN